MRSTAICAIALLALACTKDSAKSTASPKKDDHAAKAAPEAESGVAAPSADKTQKVAASGATLAENDEYTLSLQAPEQVGVGEAARVVFTVTPKKGWKLNEEFPPRLKISPPEGVDIDKPNQDKSDAVTYTTKVAKWAINVKPTAAGKKTVNGNLKFAVCTDTTCNPRKPALAFALDVK